MASLICLAALGCAASAPNVETAASRELCDAARRFAQADRSVLELATARYHRQVAAEGAWHRELEAIASYLPPGETRSAAETLLGARTVVADEPWTEAQQAAFQVLARDLGELCQVELRARI